MEFIKEATEKLYAVARKYGVNLSEAQLKQFSIMVENELKEHPALPEALTTPDAKEYYVIQSALQQLPTPEQADVLKGMKAAPKLFLLATNIQWDTDDEDADLPTSIGIPLEEILDESESIYTIAMDDLLDRMGDFITEETGYCHLGFDFY